MRRAILVAALALGCDDTAQILSLAEHGAIQAAASCQSNWTWPWSSTPAHNLFKVQVGADGSVVKSFSQHTVVGMLAPPTPIEVCGRSEACAVASYTIKDQYSSYTHTADYLLADGVLTVTLNGEYIRNQSPPYQNISPHVVVDDPIDEACTGFNLEAFGVE